MHPTVQKLFDAADRPAFCGRAQVAAENLPLVKLAAKIRHQIVEWRGIIAEAESTPDLPEEVRAKLEFLYQSVGALDRIVTDYERSGRDLTATFAQLERIFADAKKDLKIPETPAPPGKP